MKVNKEELNFNNIEVIIFLLFELFILFVNPVIELRLFNKLFDYLTNVDLLHGLEYSTRIAILGLLILFSGLFIVYVIYAFITRFLYFPPIDFDYSSKRLSPRYQKDRFKLEIYCSDIWGRALIEINKNNEFLIIGWRESSRVKRFLKRILAFIVWPFWFISLKHTIKNKNNLGL